MELSYLTHLFVNTSRTQKGIRLRKGAISSTAALGKFIKAGDEIECQVYKKEGIEPFKYMEEVRVPGHHRFLATHGDLN